MFSRFVMQLSNFLNLPNDEYVTQYYTFNTVSTLIFMRNTSDHETSHKDA